MAYTTIDDPSEYFTTTLYAGNGSDDRSITNSANAGNLNLIGFGVAEEMMRQVTIY